MGFEGVGGVCRFYFFGVMWEVMKINIDFDGQNGNQEAAYYLQASV